MSRLQVRATLEVNVWICLIRVTYFCGLTILAQKATSAGKEQLYKHAPDLLPIKGLCLRLRERGYRPGRLC